MKYIIVFTISICLLSCKKNHACFGSETVYYKWSSKSPSGVDIIVESQQNFDIRQSCISCSKKDVNDMGEIIADFLIDMEIDYEKSFNDNNPDTKMYSKSIEDYVVICQEK